MRNYSFFCSKIRYLKYAIALRLRCSVKMSIEASVRKIIAIWLLAWLLVVGGAIYLLPEARLDHSNTFHLISVYYLFCAIIGGYFYRVSESVPNQATFFSQYSGVVLFSAALIATCLMIEAGFPVGSGVLNKISLSKFFFPLFRSEILLTKFFDILFQQVFIIGVLRELKQQQLSDRKTMYLFAFGFFLLHLPLTMSIGAQAIYFILPSLFAGVVFSYLILKLRYGLFASFAMHFFFYLLVGLWLRIF